jgi:membrane fusion protein (multidrug efflux system)
MIKTYIVLICLVLLTVGGFAAHYFYPNRVEAVLNQVQDAHDRTNIAIGDIVEGVRDDVYVSYTSVTLGTRDKVSNAFDVIQDTKNHTRDMIVEGCQNAHGAITNGYDGISLAINQGQTSVLDFVTSGYLKTQENVDEFFMDVSSLFDSEGGQVEFIQVVNNSTVMNDSMPEEIAFNNIEPAVGGDYDFPPTIEREFETDQMKLDVEAVLVPREKTVISSSRDGKLKSIYFKNGDRFKKGDVLLEYHCDDLRAEWDAVHSEKRFARQKQLTTSRLFDLELASHLEKLQSSVENKQSTAKQRTMESRLKDCVIKADYDGRVVKKMANASEYTRTDRVLMEVASEGALDMEFLLPSVWLRWINIGAPLNLILTETGRNYTAVVTRIYGEVDPVSQSIQIRAQLDGYDEPLLPGMSGKAQVHIDKIREAGISGFLETQAR